MPTKDDKVFDVAKPGKRRPSATSKPVIVGHKNMIEDPMVRKGSIQITADNTDEEAVDPAKSKSEEAKLAPHEAKPIMPLAAADKSPEPSAEPVESTEPEAKPQETTDQSVKPAESEESGEASEAAEVQVSDSLPDQPETPAKLADKEDKAAQEEKARTEAIQKLIESKQYVVHVGESSHRKRGKWLIISLLILVLLVVGVDLAVDAGYIDIGLKPPINLIKN